MDLPLESLLRHSAWIERLARRLVRDPEAADELVQETWLSVLEAGEVPVRSARAWLATILRSRWTDRRRAEARRERRERAVARPEAQPSTAELLRRTSAQHEVVEAVLALDEPYREVILRRYFEGEPPRVIAARLGVPVATVKTRLARAHARLRVTLDQGHGGDGRSWLVALAPLAQRTRLAPPRAAWLATALGAAFVAVFAPRLWRASGEERAATAVATERAAEDRTAEPTARELAFSPLPERESRESTAAVSSPPTFANAMALLLRGRVLDARGAALAGIVVELRAERDGGGTTIARSDEHGEFELRSSVTRGAVHVLDEELVTAWAGRFDERGGELAVVAAPACRAGGTLEDERGAPVAGAEVALVLPPAPVADGCAAVAARTTSAGDGGFALERLPRVAGAELRFRAQGFVEVCLPLAELTSGGAPVRLVRAAAARELRGRALDATGTPLSAFVTDGTSWVRAAADGSFVLRAGAEPEALTAFASGHLPVRLGATDASPSGGPAWPDAIEFVLREAALSIRGRVLAADGAPLAGAWVWLDDPRPLAEIALDERDRIEAGIPLPGLEGLRPVVPLVENVLAGEPETGWRRVLTDAGGAFELDGLERRDYRLAALEPATLRARRADGVRAGRADVELAFAPRPDELVRTLRLRAPDGSALAGLVVTVERPVFRVPERGAALWSERAQLGPRKSDSRGEVELAGYAGEELQVRIEGPEVIARTLNLEELAPGGEVVLERACLVRLVAAGVAPGSELTALDRAGGERPLEERVEGAAHFCPRVPLEPGTTHEFRLGELATELVVRAPGEEPRHVPLRLVPGETLELRL